MGRTFTSIAAMGSGGWTAASRASDCTLTRRGRTMRARVLRFMGGEFWATASRQRRRSKLMREIRCDVHTIWFLPVFWHGIFHSLSPRHEFAQAMRVRENIRTVQTLAVITTCLKALSHPPLPSPRYRSISSGAGRYRCISLYLRTSSCDSTHKTIIHDQKEIIRIFIFIHGLHPRLTSTHSSSRPRSIATLRDRAWRRRGQTPCPDSVASAGPSPI